MSENKESKERKERTPLDQSNPEPELTGTGRDERIPMGITRLKMAAAKRKGFVRRWVNDSPGRLDVALAGGYRFVQSEASEKVGQGDDLSQRPGIDSRISRVVGQMEGGQPLRAYLMEIPEELYEADQKVKRGELDAMEEDIRRGTQAIGGAGQEGQHMYVPRSGIKIERK